MASFELGGSDIHETLGDTENQVSPLVEYKDFLLDFETELDDMLYYSQIPSNQIHSLQEFLIGNDLDENNISKHAEIDGYIIIEDGNEGEYIIGFNKESNEFYLEDRNIAELLEAQNIEQQNQIEDISKKERLLSSVMYAIEHIFRVNDREWMQRLNEDDTFSIDASEYPWSEIPEFSGKDQLQIQELQKVARNLLADMSLNLGELDDTVGGELKSKLAQHEEKYLDYIVGIGDMYEGGAHAFHSNEDGEPNVTQEEISTLVDSIVENKTTQQCFEYMLEKHAEIEANNYQSTEVMRTYSAWNTAINKAVLHKLKGDNAEDKLFLQYAKIVSGRDVPEYSTLLRTIDLGRGQTQEVRTSHSLDNDLFDVHSASEALLYVFEREGGIMSQIGEQITIKDPVIERMTETEKNPKHIFDRCASLLENKIEGVGDSGGEGLLGVTGFGNLFSLNGTESYEDLSISEKMQISILVRLSKKLESVQNPSNHNSRYRSQHNGNREWGNGNGQISMDRLSSMFIEVAEDGQDAVIASINDNFDGGFLGRGHKDSSDYGLESYKAEIFDLYNDIWGNGGLFDMSDTTIGWVKFGAQFGAILIGSIALGMAALPVLTAAGVLSAAAAGSNAAMITSTALASVAVSRVVMPEGYDSNADMLLDVGTDCLVAVLFGRIGGVLTQRTHAGFIAAGGTWTSGWTTTAAGRTHLGANIIDLGLFGIGSEILRNIVIRNEFIEIPFTDSTLRIPFHMDESNRFSYSDFHQYVAPQIREYFSHQQS